MARTKQTARRAHQINPTEKICDTDKAHVATHKLPAAIASYRTELMDTLDDEDDTRAKFNATYNTTGAPTVVSDIYAIVSRTMGVTFNSVRVVRTRNVARVRLAWLGSSTQTKCYVPITTDPLTVKVEIDHDATQRRVKLDHSTTKAFCFTQKDENCTLAFRVNTEEPHVYGLVFYNSDAATVKR